jgi:hypothetical protein
LHCIPSLPGSAKLVFTLGLKLNHKVAYQKSAYCVLCHTSFTGGGVVVQLITLSLLTWVEVELRRWQWLSHRRRRINNLLVSTWDIMRDKCLRDFLPQPVWFLKIYFLYSHPFVAKYLKSSLSNIIKYFLSRLGHKSESRT